MIDESVQRQTEKLHCHRAPQQRGAGLEDVRIEVDQAGLENVAGNDDADAQVRKAFFPFSSMTPFFFSRAPISIIANSVS